MWSLFSKAAIVLGLLVVAVTPAKTHSPLSTQAYVASNGVVSGTAAPVLLHEHMQAGRLPEYTTAPQSAMAQGATAEKPKASLPNVFGWTSLWLGTMAGVATLVWNGLSAKNREMLEEEKFEDLDSQSAWAGVAATALAMTLSTSPAMAAVRLPPLDTDPNRCERGFIGNTLGMANGVSDRAIDLRFCNLENQNFEGGNLAGGLLSDAKFKGSNFTEAVISKVYAVNADFSGANFTSAVLDRSAFDGADMSGANFYNAVITGSTFKDTNLTGAIFEEALLGSEDAKRICANPTLSAEARGDVGCRE